MCSHPPGSTIERLLPELVEKVLQHIYSSPTGEIRLRPIKRQKDGKVTVTYKISTNDDETPFISLSPLRACRQFYDRGRNLVWKCNELSIVHIGCTCRQWRASPGSCRYSLDERLRPLVQHLKVNLPCDEVYRSLSPFLFDWRSLKSINLSLGAIRGYAYDARYCDELEIYAEEVKLGHASFVRLLEARTFEQRPGSNDTCKMWVAGMLQALREAADTNGFMSHLKKKITINTGTPTFNFRDEHNPFAERLFESDGNPEDVLLELNEAFGGELWLDGALCYEEGTPVKQVTICLGELPPGKWRMLSGDRGALKQRIHGTEPSEEGERFKGFQYERDLAELFVTLIAALMVRTDLKMASRLVRDQVQRDGEDFPPFPKEASAEQFEGAKCLAKRAVEFWSEKEELPLGLEEVELLYKRCLEGPTTALARRDRPRFQHGYQKPL